MKAVGSDRVTCAACSRQWSEHPGIAVTCKNLRRARSALKIIAVWAGVEDGRGLTPDDVLALVNKALGETE